MKKLVTVKKSISILKSQDVKINKLVKEAKKTDPKASTSSVVRELLKTVLN